MRSEWTKKKLMEIADFNPKESITKGTKAKKIAMDKLRPFYRDVPGYEITEFSGGTKFRNGDTIMARITPCLENGKTAQVNILNKGEVGFGSTEYIVFRAKKGIADPDFIYYLVCSPVVREPAIKSMVGSSGRQRVQTDVLQNLEVAVPPYEEQVRIAALLSALDDKIVLNKKINMNLEQQVSAIYQAWFEEYFLTDSIKPDSWLNVTLGDISKISSGKRPFDKSPVSTDAASIPLVGAASVMGYTSGYNHVERILVTGRVGTHGIVQRFHTPCWASDNTLVIVSSYYEYTNQILRRIDYSNMNRGSTQPLITQGDLKNISILLPDSNTIAQFEENAGTLMNQYEANEDENRYLASIRDMLLPQLISGALDVSNIDL